MLPPTVEKMRVRPDISTPAPPKEAAFSAECATVIKLKPSPRVPGALTDCKSEVVTTKRMLATSIQRASALRAAPAASLPALMLACGAESEDESAILMVLVGHLTCMEFEASVNWSVYERTITADSIRVANKKRAVRGRFI
jgi:hypothetical protein